MTKCKQVLHLRAYTSMWWITLCAFCIFWCLEIHMNYLTSSGLPAPIHNFSFAKCRVPARGGENTVWHNWRGLPRDQSRLPCLSRSVLPKLSPVSATYKRLFKLIQGKTGVCLFKPPYFELPFFGQAAQTNPRNKPYDLLWPHNLRSQEGSKPTLPRCKNAILYDTPSVMGTSLGGRGSICSTWDTATVSRPTNQISLLTPGTLWSEHRPTGSVWQQWWQRWCGHVASVSAHQHWGECCDTPPSVC